MNRAARGIWLGHLHFMATICISVYKFVEESLSLNPHTAINANVCSMPRTFVHHDPTVRVAQKVKTSIYHLCDPGSIPASTPEMVYGYQLGQVGFLCVLWSLLTVRRTEAPSSVPAREIFVKL